MESRILLKNSTTLWQFLGSINRIVTNSNEIRYLYVVAPKFTTHLQYFVYALFDHQPLLQVATTNTLCSSKQYISGKVNENCYAILWVLLEH